MRELSDTNEFSEWEYAAKKKQTRRDRFLAEIEAIIPRSSLVNVINPHYPNNAGPGRPAVGLERILRMYVAQQCFGLSDEDLDLNRESAPDATTLLKFRHLLEAHQLTAAIFSAINAHLAEKGLFLREGTIDFVNVLRRLRLLVA